MTNRTSDQYKHIRMTNGLGLPPDKVAVVSLVGKRRQFGLWVGTETLDDKGNPIGSKDQCLGTMTRGAARELAREILERSE